MLRFGPLMWLVILFTVLPTSFVRSQETLAPQVDPRDLGLAIARGAEPISGEGQRIMVPDELDEPVVGKLYFKSGDRRVVLLPSGRLTSVPAASTTPTDRPFDALDPKTLKTRLEENEFPGFKTKATRRYVYVYNTSEEFATATTRILETMHPKLIALCKRRDLSVVEPEVPLVVVMFRTEEEFQNYREMPEGVVAYYNGISNYVVMYEKSKLVEVAPMIAVKQAISTIAHEGVHQILHNIGVQRRLSGWPPWVSEGLPEYFSPTDVARGIRWKGAGEINDLRMKNLDERFRANPAAFGRGDFLKSTVMAEQLNSDGYASAWAITYFLAEHRPRQFFEYLSEVEKIGPLGALSTDQQLELFETHFGEDWARLETELFNRLKRLPYVDPVLNQPHYVVLMKAGGKRATVITSSPASIPEARQQMLSSLPLSERAVAQFLVNVYPNQALARQAASGALR